MNELTLADLINCKRASGYDAKFEALLCQPWYCPHCKCSKTILQTTIQPKDKTRGIGCSGCDREGIAPVDGSEGHTLFRKILTALAPFNRVGTA